MSNIDKFENNDELKKPDWKEYILCDYIHMKF